MDFGPQFPGSYDPSDFSIQALVDTGWRMAIKYELERVGTATVTIQVMGASPFTQTLNGDGMGQGRTAQFTLPVYTGKGPHPALISFKATRDISVGKVNAAFRLLAIEAGGEMDASLPKDPSGLEVAALGPLPLGGVRRGGTAPQRARALNLYDTTLSPTPGGYVYAFKVGAKFNRWAANIKKTTLTGNTYMPETVRHVKAVAERIGPNQTKTGNWDGLNDKKVKVKPGRYSLFVTAWWSGSNIGHWNAADDSDPIHIN